MIPVLILAVLIGVTVGLMGGGGSILTVPLLVYVAHMDEKVAIATSLFVVGFTSIGGLVPHVVARRVQWRTGATFGATAMIGAYLGGRVAEFISGAVLITLFSLMMLATATAMIRGRRDPGTSQTSGRRPIAKIVLEGVVVGFVTGLVGAGGGFLVVPALVLLGGLPMAAAVSTSLMVVSMNCFAALFGYLSSVQIDWSVALSVTAAALVGSVFGGMLVGRVHADSLRKGFGWFVLVMGSFILVRQLLA